MGKMLSLKILNSKDAKKILKIISEHWGAEIDKDYAFLINSKNNVYIINKEVGEFPLETMRINSMGLYFGELGEDCLRLSIDGSQIVGPHAKKNVVEASKEEMASWLRGNDLDKEFSGSNGFVILKHGKDYIGCGRYSNGTIKNFVPKTRRIKSAD